MDTKLIKVIKEFGEFALIKVDGREVKAKVEGKIPSLEFWGEISNKEGKVVIRVIDNAIIADRNDILRNLGVKATKGNFFILDVLKGLSLPIKSQLFKLHDVYNLPPLLIGILAKSRKDTTTREQLLLIYEVLNENKKGTFTTNELELFLNSLFFANTNNEKVLVIDSEESSGKWFGYIEFDEDKFKKLILTTEIDKVSIYILLEKFPNSYKLDINIYGNVSLSSSSTEELKLKLEEIGISPIFVNIIVTGGGNEESSSIEV